MCQREEQPHTLLDVLFGNLDYSRKSIPEHGPVVISDAHRSSPIRDRLRLRCVSHDMTGSKRSCSVVAEQRLGGEHPGRNTGATNCAYQPRGQPASTNGRNYYVEEWPDGRQLIAQARVAFDHKRVVVSAGDVSFRMFRGQLGDPLGASLFQHIDEIDLAAELAHRIDLYLRRSLRHHDYAGFAEQRTRKGKRLPEVSR